MKLVLIVALGAGLTASASLAQSPPLRGATSPDGSARAPVAGRAPASAPASAPAAADAQVDAARTRSEARLREREDKARRTLKGICSGC